MGCASSKLETELAVKRCKASKQYIKQAVADRHAFAAAHASYVKSLKNTGAAIRQFADVEVPKEDVPTGPSVSHHHQVLHSVSDLRPPPQPPEDPFLRRAPLPRAASMPPLAIKTIVGSTSKNSLATHSSVSENEEEEEYAHHKHTRPEPMFDPFDGIPESGADTLEDLETKSSAVERSDLDDDDDDDDGDDDEDDDDGGGGSGGELRESEQLRLQTSSLQQAKPGVNDKRGSHRDVGEQSKVSLTHQRSKKSDKDFGTILRELDDLFLESFNAGREACQLLDAQRDYYHVPFVDERSGIKEHNKKVSHILTWTRSSLEPHSEKEQKDILPADNLTLASTLDRLHAWEKKRYDELKAAETTRLELDKRSAQLEHQKKRRESATAIERTKARFKSLHTRYFVEFEAVDAAAAEVKKLRDVYLYKQLMELLKALKKMWSDMYNCHKKQIPLVEELKYVEAVRTTKENSDLCKKITDDLEREVTSWHTSLNEVFMFQNNCIMALLHWLHQNAEQSESDAVGNLPVPQNVDIPLYDLCQAWADVLKNLSAERVLQSLQRFSTILHEMATKQANEIKQGRRKEDLRRELEKKKIQFEAFESKYKTKASVKEVAQQQQGLLRHPIQERRALIELLEKNLAEEDQRHAKLCDENSLLIFQSLKDALPDVIQSITEFSHACAKEYGALHDLANSE